MEYSISSFVVLDDDDDMTAVRDNFVHIDGKLGLNEEYAKKAVDILNK